LLQIYSADQGRLTAISGPYDSAALAAAYWIDIYDPTPQDQQAVEQALGIRLHVPEEPETFQISSPLRSSDGQTTLTALLLTGLDARTIPR
jgi:magnesium transporter